MSRPILSIVLTLACAGCGEVPQTPDASPDAALSPDAPVGCSGDPACDDTLACNGSESCVDGTCTAGTALDCGISDACVARGCDDAIGCTEAPVMYDVDWVIIGGSIGTVSLVCDGSDIVHSEPCGTLPASALRFSCRMTADGQMYASYAGVAQCVSMADSGIMVTVGCSTVIAPSAELRCCFR